MPDSTDDVRLLKPELYDVVDEVEPTHRCLPNAELDRLREIEAQVRILVADITRVYPTSRYWHSVEHLQRLIDGGEGRG